MTPTTPAPSPTGKAATMSDVHDDGPNPLDGRLLAMAAILRGEGGEVAADAIEIAAAYVREAWRGSDDGSITEALETIAAYVAELMKIVRARPDAAREADLMATETPEGTMSETYAVTTDRHWRGCDEDADVYVTMPLRRAPGLRTARGQDGVAVARRTDR